MEKFASLAGSCVCFGLVVRYCRMLLRDRCNRLKVIKLLLEPEPSGRACEEWWNLASGFLDDKSFANLSATCRHLRGLEPPALASPEADVLAAHALAHMTPENCDFARTASDPGKVCCGVPVAAFHFRVHGNVFIRTRIARLCFQCGSTMGMDRFEPDGLLDVPPPSVIPPGFMSRSTFTMGGWLAPALLASTASLGCYLWRLQQKGEWFLILSLLMQCPSWLFACYFSPLPPFESVVFPLVALSRMPGSSLYTFCGFPMVLWHAFVRGPWGTRLGSRAWVLDLMPVVGLAASVADTATLLS
jgi:hypothetical protein